MANMFGQIFFSLVLCFTSIVKSTRSEATLTHSCKNTTTYLFASPVLNETYDVIADAIENLEVRDDDVYVCTFPRSGTHWMSEMIWNIVHNLDFEGARAVKQAQRMPFLGLSKQAVGIDPSDPASNDRLLEYTKSVAKFLSPRVIMTHLPFQFLPRQLREGEKKGKIVYVSRNPKDVCISNYHFHKLIAGYCGTLEEFCKAFIQYGSVLYTPYWDHVNAIYERKDKENVLFVKFEDMKRDLSSVIKQVSEFLGKELTEQQVNDLKEHLSFASMQKNPAVNQEEDMNSRCKGGSCEEKFIRNGEVGQWKTVMSKELIEQFDDWIKTNSGE